MRRAGSTRTRTRRRTACTQVLLKEGIDGKAKILVKGKGVNLPLPTLPLTQPVTVQLRSRDGGCWEAVYGAPATKNDATQFKDKAD